MCRLKQSNSYQRAISLSWVLLLAFTTLSAQIPVPGEYTRQSVAQPNDEIPKRLDRKFKRDAARLALRMHAQQEDLRYQNIIIPESTIEDIYRVLTSIYRSDETAKSIAACNVHTFPNPSIDHFVLIFDREVSWAAPLQDGISETDNEEINRLLDEYDLVIEKHVQWNDEHDAITIRSKAPLNMSALANEFYNQEGVVEIDLGTPKVVGNDIKIERTSNGWSVTYLLKFGSYISDEGKLHSWEYLYSDDGKVSLIKESGDDVPDWMRCILEQDLLTNRL